MEKGKNRVQNGVDASVPAQVQSPRKPRGAAAFRWWVLIQEKTW